MEIEIDYEVAAQLLFSFIIGATLGLEREYRSKAAGLRTMIVICVGSTIFTQISLSLGNDSPDRIASNIVTGIGFLGAGVIFKDGLTITGITTATTIWISAALGMAVGSNQYFIAIIGSLIVLMVLIVFEKIQQIIERLHQARVYRIAYEYHSSFISELEQEVRKHKLTFERKKDIKTDGKMFLLCEILGGEKGLDALNRYLQNDARVKSYEY